MANDPRKLKPSQLCRLLNSTALGEVIGERQLYRHRTRAGLRIGDGQTVDLLRYVAWLVQERHKPRPVADATADPYEVLKDRARARNAALSLAGRDIGDIPQVVNPERRASGSARFQTFCETYFPQTFHLPWSPDHLRVIAKIEKAVLEGGLFAMAMPRGSGKTSICECACIWALLTGAREFVALIGSDEGHAEDMLASIKMELENNPLLLEDFPEVVYPIQKLDGIANRCSGQLYQGERTYISWTASEIILPTIAGSLASGGIIKVAGLTGRIRGMKCKRADGRALRPALVVLDDPQTDQSARSVSQCAERERVLTGAVLGLAGPGRKISGIMPCTVIRPGDMADRILDRDKHPQWQGERTKMVYSFPTEVELWKEYAQVRADGLRNEQGLAPATQFYAQHQEALEAGAQIAWPERFNHDELSAIQHAMNLKLQNEQAFFAEYQNEPLPEVQPDRGLLGPDEIAGKLSRLSVGTVPLRANHLTLFIDVQGSLLYYLVAAWEGNFTGQVIDYGAYPRQQRHYFSLRDAQPKLAEVIPGAGQEGLIYAGLENLTADLLSRSWRREDGTLLSIERCLIDANWGLSTEVVYQFCRQSVHKAVLIPSHGRYVGAASTPFSDYRQHPGEKLGHNWRIPSVAGKRAIRHVIYDTNFWKSFVHSRLKVKFGDEGCLSLFGDDAERHRLIAEHLTAEYPVTTTGRGRTVEEWKQRVDRPDNHWLDCLVGCAVAGSMLGAHLASEGEARPQRKKVVIPEYLRR